MIDNESPYSPCPCGSGKKYKFCCYQKGHKALDPEAMRFLWESIRREVGASEESPERVESWNLCQRGLKLMAASRYDEAIELFRQAEQKDPSLYTAANNWALCLWVTGRLNEALQVQKKNLDYGGETNPFGLANMATFLYTNGEEQAARAILEQALSCEMPSVDSCLKVCDTLARFRLHEKILTFADASAYRDSDGVRFFTGVAAANLGDSARAKQDLGRVPTGHFKSDVARGYLKCLRNGSTPHTLRKDWPYFNAFELCPPDILKTGGDPDTNAFFKRRIYLDFCEALLNESAATPDLAIQALRFLSHPETPALLWKLLKGSFGPDAYRMAALQQLEELGELKKGRAVEVLLDGKRRPVVSAAVKLNPDFHFGKKLSSKLEALYAKAVTEGRKRFPDWAKAAKDYQQILREEPDFYPARYNYAVTLVHRGRNEEAKDLLLKLAEKHPEYLFARATLMQLYLWAGDLQAAEELNKTTAMPDETHPSAMATWSMAQALYFKEIKDYEAARKSAETAHAISPDNPSAQDLYERSKTW